MANMQTMRLKADAETTALELLAQEKKLSKIAVIRQVLRIHQLIVMRAVTEENLFFQNPDARNKAEVVVV